MFLILCSVQRLTHNITNTRVPNLASLHRDSQPHILSQVSKAATISKNIPHVVQQFTDAVHQQEWPHELSLAIGCKLLASSGVPVSG